MATGATSVCEACRGVRYCSVSCQRLHWKAHKPTYKGAAEARVRKEAAELKGGPSLDLLKLSKRRPGHPLALRGDRLFSASWDTLDQGAVCLPLGATVDMWTGGISIRLKGPLTASEVLDAILKTERREILSTTYPQGATDAVTGCAKCPRQGFCGVRLVTKAAPGALAQWEALWSDLFCHAGLSETGLQTYHSDNFFSPAKGKSEAMRVNHTAYTFPGQK
jgi:hypothetical protein